MPASASLRRASGAIQSVRPCAATSAVTMRTRPPTSRADGRAHVRLDHARRRTAGIGRRQRDDPSVTGSAPRRARCRARRSIPPESRDRRPHRARARCAMRMRRRRACERCAAHGRAERPRASPASPARVRIRARQDLHLGEQPRQVLGVHALLAAARARALHPVDRRGIASVASASTARTAACHGACSASRIGGDAARRSARARSRRRRTSRPCTSTARRSPPASARATRRCRRRGGSPSPPSARRDSALP